MTRKDVKRIAKVLHSVRPEAPSHMRQWVMTVDAFSEALAQENLRFNLGKFEKACETGEGVTEEA